MIFCVGFGLWSCLICWVLVVDFFHFAVPISSSYFPQHLKSHGFVADTISFHGLPPIIAESEWGINMVEAFLELYFGLEV